MLMMVQRWSRRSNAAEAISSKDFRPVTESFIGSDDGGTAVVVALGDHLKEETGLRLVQLQVTHFINNQ